MFKLRVPFKRKGKGVQFLQQIYQYTTKNDGNTIVPFDKCLIISKLSRYEFERNRLFKFNEQEFERILRNRGTDYDLLMNLHHANKKFENNVVDVLRSMGVNVQVKNRFNCTKEHIDWASVIIPTGGDGTFLLAASKVKDPRKTVIGLNSEPSRSEGFLCLPKKYSFNIREAIERIQQGNFRWLLRSRIRTTLIGNKISDKPTDLHVTNLANNTDSNSNVGVSKVLPYLALNEVFIGESLSARVSHLEITLDDSKTTTKLKSSGLCVSTGTGSTSWHLSINRLPTQSVTELLRLLNLDSVRGHEEELASDLAEKYNKNLVFDADDTRMGYTIRDLISAGVWPSPKGIQPRGFVSKVCVKSNCYDAGLVIDGGVSFQFNDGTKAILEIYPEDSLRTVLLDE